MLKLFVVLGVAIIIGAILEWVLPPHRREW
jgi:uncharacterized membrane protein